MITGQQVTRIARSGPEGEGHRKTPSPTKDRSLMCWSLYQKGAGGRRGGQGRSRLSSLLCQAGPKYGLLMGSHLGRISHLC